MSISTSTTNANMEVKARGLKLGSWPLTQIYAMNHNIIGGGGLTTQRIMVGTR